LLVAFAFRMSLDDWRRDRPFRLLAALGVPAALTIGHAGGQPPLAASALFALTLGLLRCGGRVYYAVSVAAATVAAGHLVALTRRRAGRPRYIGRLVRPGRGDRAAAGRAFAAAQADYTATADLGVAPAAQLADFYAGQVNAAK
jgi:hypothetical protein